MSCQKLAGNAELTYSEGYPAGDSFQQALIDEAVAARRPPMLPALHRAAVVQGIRRLRPRRPRPDGAAGGADPGRERRAAAHCVVILNNGSRGGR
jgi:hypothetical protein